MTDSRSSFSSVYHLLLRKFRGLPLLGRVTLATVATVSLPLVVTTLALATLSFIPIRWYVRMTSGVNRSSKRLDGKTVLVTGGSDGLGREMAFDLAARGARVIIANRNIERGREVAEEIRKSCHNNQVFARPLDLSLISNVRDFARNFLEQEHRLDILINNAGVASWEQDIEWTSDGLEKLMATNFFGHFLLTHLLINKLKQSVPARIINASSIVHWRVRSLDLDNLDFHKGTTGFMSVYSTTKLCMLLFTRELAQRLQGTGVTVNCFHPGIVDTHTYDKQPWFAFLLFWLPRKTFFKTPKEGAQTPLYLATSNEVSGITGQYFSDCQVANTSRLGKDMKLARQLWERSEKLVGLRDEEKLVC